ncbi:hypothetical protein STEG23_001231, partial [Scotinomys teguina]
QMSLMEMMEGEKNTTRPSFVPTIVCNCPRALTQQRHLSVVSLPSWTELQSPCVTTLMCGVFPPLLLEFREGEENDHEK